MLTIFVLDSSAESRTTIIRRFDQLLQTRIADYQLLPRIQLRPVSFEELKFSSAPDICLIGDEILSRDLTALGRVRKLLPDTPLLVQLNSELERFTVVEQLARLGADDVLEPEIGAKELVRKIVLLLRKVSRTRSGKLLVVDSGKGGVGVTTIAASLAELLSQSGKSVIVVDFDYETQDLSRFLQARPFVNENLQLLFEGSRPLTEESVEQCLVPVWEEYPELRCMAPLANGDILLDSQMPHSRTLVSIFEILDQLADCVIVDIGALRGILRQTLHRVADKLIFVMNNDPASFYASADQLSHVRSWLGRDNQLLVVENAPYRHGLAHTFLRDEFLASVGLTDESERIPSVPFCRQGHRWPGSGGTLASLAKQPVIRALSKIVEQLELVEAEELRSLKLDRVSEMLRSRFIRPVPRSLQAPATQLRVSHTGTLLPTLPLLPVIGEPELGGTPHAEESQDLISEVSFS